jgi:hypothetical protein
MSAAEDRLEELRLAAVGAAELALSRGGTVAVYLKLALPYLPAGFREDAARELEKLREAEDAMWAARRARIAAVGGAVTP